MQIGMIGLGRMGANMVRRLLRGGHHCVVFDVSPEAAAGLVDDGGIGGDLVERPGRQLTRPRAVWLMVPAGRSTRRSPNSLPHLEADDIVIDGGNSYYVDDLRRAKELAQKGIHYVDVGTSGGVWGLERGYCMMIGGEATAVERLDPIFARLAPGIGEIGRTPGARRRRAPRSRVTCTAGRTVPATSSRWSTTASNTG